ncbi:MAG: aminotransferase class V-fold PLP-dependent enzyme [Clostridia bacterium]|nr:aminotransferase class V-fold PLP-dependent enzyme [Clostridia bacterium]
MIYLDNAATSFPNPESVIKAVADAMYTVGGNPGRSAHKLALAAAGEVYVTRERAAELFGARPENIVFTYNTTYAINNALKSSYIYGTHVLISDLEHNSVLRPTAAVTGNSFASYSMFDSALELKGEERTHAIISSIRSKMRPLTRTLICTARSNVTGTPMPIREIGRYCRENGLFFIVDGAQSAGYDDINIERDNIDVLCVPGHKGLYGPSGTGMMIFSTSAVLSERIGSFIEGGNGVSSLDVNMPEALPEKLESGTLGVPGIMGLGVALKYVSDLGINRIAEHDSSLIQKAYMSLCFNKKLEIYSYEPHSPILLFNVAGKDSEDTAAELDSRGICVRAGYHCAPLAHKRASTPVGGAVRISVGYTNTEDEIDEFIKAVYDITGK